MTKKERYVEALIHLEHAKSFIGELDLSQQIERIQKNLCSMLAIQSLPPVKK